MPTGCAATASAHPSSAPHALAAEAETARATSEGEDGARRHDTPMGEEAALMAFVAVFAVGNVLSPGDRHRLLADIHSAMQQLRR
jgi:hypothetical protein